MAMNKYISFSPVSIWMTFEKNLQLQMKQVGNEILQIKTDNQDNVMM